MAAEVAVVVGDARIAVAGDEQTPRTETFGDGGRVPPGAEGGVEGHLTGRGLQEVDQLLQQDGRVGEHHLVLTEP